MSQETESFEEWRERTTPPARVWTRRDRLQVVVAIVLAAAFFAVVGEGDIALTILGSAAVTALLAAWKWWAMRRAARR